MQNPGVLENAGKIITHEEDIEDLINYIKAMEKQIDDNLQQTLRKSTTLIAFSKNLEQIQLMSEFLSRSIKEDGDKKKLFDALRRKIYDNQNLILKEWQRSMLRALEVLADTQSNLILFSSFNEIVRTFDDIQKKL